MGLDTTHNCWHGPYSSFSKFRQLLAEEIGINLNDYLGYGRGGTKDLSTIKHDIEPLLNHSDCDGILTVEQCKQIVRGLNNILENLSEKNQSFQGFKEDITQFRDGCELAIEEDEPVEFG